MVWASGPCSEKGSGFTFCSRVQTPSKKGRCPWKQAWLSEEPGTDSINSMANEEERPFSET